MGDRKTNHIQKTEGDRSRAIAQPPAHINTPKPTHPLLSLQRQLGNRATTELIQAKLTVGAVNDVYEQEADRTADKVMRMPEGSSTLQLQTEKIQAKSTGETTPIVTPVLEQQIQGMRGSGQPLAPEVRRFYEPRMGYPLGGVRVHTDSHANSAATQLQAKAFTLGRDIFFASGHYEPQTPQGKWLLAHELTHTLQQTPSISRKAIRPSDPGFKAVVDRTQKAAKQQKQHIPAATKAKQAQAAAKSPGNEVASKASAKQVEQMDAAKPKAFNRSAFKSALLAKIAAIAPKNLKEADDFKSSGKVGGLKGDLIRQVDSDKKQSQGSVETTVKAPPSSSGIPARTATPLPPGETTAPIGNINAAQAAPKPKAAAEVSLQAGSQSLDQQMSSAEVTDDQLKKSNEPDFQSASAAKNQAQKDAIAAPQQYRKAEQSTLTQAQAQAVTTANTHLQGMQGSRGQKLTQVKGSQQQTQSKDEQDRARIANDIQTIYNRTKKQAEDRIARVDTEVNQAFDQGSSAAQQAFEDYVDRRMRAYKDDRYDGIIGAGRWVKDKFLGLPSEVNVFYTEGRSLYIQRMDAVIDRVSLIVETGLNEAKGAIAQGRKEVQDYVSKQPGNLVKAAQDAAKTIQSQFDQLEQTVDDKQSQLLDSLAQKYSDNLQKIDSRIEEMKAQNRGLVDAAFDAIGGVIKTILELKAMLMGVLAKAASAISKIIKDPIGFLGNLVAGVKQGFMNFVGNIASHLQKGLMGWLFGAIAEAGVQLPESFDLKGILSLIMQVLGATWTFIRARAVNILGEKVVKAMETGAEIFMILATKGIMGVWEYIKEQVSSLKDTVIEGIKSFVQDSIIKAGVTWILGLLNPAGAFIKACKAIYDVIMFFVERGSQIISLVNAVLDSVSAIADGATGVAASAVEAALSKALPVAISFLAALLGVTGISKKIQDVIKKVQAPIHKAIDWLINKAMGLAKAAGKLFGVGKGKEEKDNKLEDRSPEERIRLAKQEIHTNLSTGIDRNRIPDLLDHVKKKYNLVSLTIKEKPPHGVVISGQINPTFEETAEVIKDDPERRAQAEAAMDRTGEFTVFFRTMSIAELNAVRVGKTLKPQMRTPNVPMGMNFITTDAEYAKKLMGDPKHAGKYEYLVRIVVEPGTQEKLEDPEIARIERPNRPTERAFRGRTPRIPTRNSGERGVVVLKIEPLLGGGGAMNYGITAKSLEADDPFQMFNAQVISIIVVGKMV
ncbi:MAG: DUF4157 domain-containing protein [Alkalinema sp. RU_4_3]|nr:DUF4157 domain-containing protein [Alkalinema sp. RU_4_3]